MKQKMVMCLLAGILVLGMSGCGAQEVEVPEVENVETAEEEPVPEETAEEEGDEQEKTDAEDQLKEVPTVDDAAESGKTEPEETEAASAPVVYEDGGQITLDPSWTYADHSKINSGAAVLYKAAENRKEIVVGVNAGEDSVPSGRFRQSDRRHHRSRSDRGCRCIFWHDVQRWHTGEQRHSADGADLKREAAGSRI